MVETSCFDFRLYSWDFVDGQMRCPSNHPDSNSEASYSLAFSMLKGDDPDQASIWLFEFIRRIRFWNGSSQTFYTMNHSRNKNYQSHFMKPLRLIVLMGRSAPPDHQNPNLSRQTWHS